MYLSLLQLAESLGVSEKVVEDWIRNEGLPHIPDRGRPLFDRGQVADWATAHGLAAQAGFLAPAAPAFATVWRIETLLRAGGVWRNVAPSQLTELFAKILAALPGASGPVQRLLVQRLRARGGVTTAPVGGGFALPHLSTRVALGRESGTVALVLLCDPLDSSEPPPDGEPITRLFFFVPPTPRAYLDLLGRLRYLLVSGPLRELIARGASDEEIFQAVGAADRDVKQ